MKKLISTLTILLLLLPVFAGTGIGMTPLDIQGKGVSAINNYYTEYYGATQYACNYRCVLNNIVISEGYAYVRSYGVGNIVNVCIVYEYIRGSHFPTNIEYVVLDTSVYPNRLTFSDNGGRATAFRY